MPNQDFDILTEVFDAIVSSMEYKLKLKVKTSLTQIYKANQKL